MNSLPLTHRRIYLWTLVFIFVIVSPILVLYASGYRIGSGLTLVETGGVYVQVAESGAELFIDDAYIGRGNLFQKSFFEQNLVPDTYAVRVEKDRHHTWHKELSVHPRRVSEAQALLVLEEPVHTKLVSESVIERTDTVPTTTNVVSDERFTDLRDAFDTARPDALVQRADSATTSLQWDGATTTAYVRGDIGVWKATSTLYARWLGELDEIPYLFCRKMECYTTVAIDTVPADTTHIDFVPGSTQFLLLARPQGIFVTELDARAPHNIFPVYSGTDVSFQVIDEDIYVRNDTDLFHVTY